MSTSIVSKIRKLLRLAESDNENEAEVAARLADKLMREHAISLAGLDEAALLEEDPVGSHALEVGLTSWRAKLAWAMASQCNVSALRFNRYTDSHPTETDASGRAKPLAGGFKKRVFMIAYGHRSDLEVWGYLYEVAEREIQKAAAVYRASAEAPLGWDGSVSRAAMNRFRMGAVLGLDSKLSARRRVQREAASHPEALVVLSRGSRAKAEMVRHNPSTGTYRGGTGGNRAGYDAGGRININPGVTGGKGPGLIKG